MLILSKKISAVLCDLCLSALNQDLLLLEIKNPNAAWLKKTNAPFGAGTSTSMAQALSFLQAFFASTVTVVIIVATTATPATPEGAQGQDDTAAGNQV